MSETAPPTASPNRLYQVRVEEIRTGVAYVMAPNPDEAARVAAREKAFETAFEDASDPEYRYAFVGPGTPETVEQDAWDGEADTPHNQEEGDTRSCLEIACDEERAREAAESRRAEFDSQPALPLDASRDDSAAAAEEVEAAEAPPLIPTPPPDLADLPPAVRAALLAEKGKTPPPFTREALNEAFVQGQNTFAGRRSFDIHLEAESGALSPVQTHAPVGLGYRRVARCEKTGGRWGLRLMGGWK
jgi:hypothetical protein